MEQFAYTGYSGGSSVVYPKDCLRSVKSRTSESQELGWLEPYTLGFVGDVILTQGTGASLIYSDIVVTYSLLIQQWRD